MRIVEIAIDIEIKFVEGIDKFRHFVIKLDEVKHHVMYSEELNRKFSLLS